MQKKKWGRQPVFGERRLTTLQLSPEDREVLDRIGDGNMSEGVRRLVDGYRQQSLTRIEEKNAA